VRQEFSHLRVYSDWAVARLAAQSERASLSAAEIRGRVKALLDVPGIPEQPYDVETGNRWERDGGPEPPSDAVHALRAGLYEGRAYASDLDHTWMLFPPGLSGFADWPDLAACHAPAPLLIQYNRDDPLFPSSGAERAHERIGGHYAAPPASYLGQFYDGGHKFDRAMQHEAFAWLREQLLT
jgi:hypothetical protein